MGMRKVESAAYGIPRRLGVAVLVFLSGTGIALAQGPTSNDETTPAATSDPQPPAKPAPAPPTAAVPNTFERWVDLQTATFQTRYRYIETSAGVVSTRQGQDSGGIKARVKIDPKGRFSVNAGIATGNGFTSGWNNMGVGTGDRVDTWYLKQLFLAAAPVKGLEFSYGGIAPVRGESTEITSWDNDGYLLGERVTVKIPKEMYFDEISATTGYLGDTTMSSFSGRYRNIDQVNYRHFLVSKKFSSALTVSTDYTWLSGVGTLRTAFSAKVPAVVVDTVRWEQYKRFGTTGAFGFAAYGERNLGSRFAVGGGYADIDANYGGLNADRFNKGRRVYETGTVKLTKEFS